MFFKSLNSKEDKRNKETKTRFDKQKTARKMVDLNPNTSMIAKIQINGLNTPLKTRIGILNV